MADFPRLFEPGRIGSLELRNRIILGAILTRYDEEDGRLTQRHISYLTERAKGGAALITTDGSAPMLEGRQRPNQMGIYDDRFIPRLKELADAIHAHGAKISVQLMHGGTRGSESSLPGSRAIAPSAVPYFVTGVVPHEVTREEIALLVEGYAQAAYRCRRAGCDAVEMHAAHGYLGSQFLSPHTNKRTDEYGGSVENRCRFVVEIVRRIKQLCGRDFTVLIKMNGDDQLDGGVTVEDAVAQARILADAGYDALLISSGLRETVDWQIQPYNKEIPAFVHLPAAIKQAVSIPVIAVGRIKTPAVAERVLAAGQADFICIARGLIADPYWPAKAAEGRANEILICIGENYGCLDRDVAKYPAVTCTINPAVGAEDQFQLRPAETAKRVAVLGGGLGGMRAAATLAQRGHEVTLFEQSDRIGGSWNALVGRRTELRAIVNHLRQEMARHGVAVKLGAQIDVEVVQQQRPDAVVVSAAARPVVPAIPGVDGPNVVHAHHVLLGVAETGPRVAVLGSGLVAVETALALAGAGKTVSLVAPGKMAGEVAFSLRVALMSELAQNGVHLFDYSTVMTITAERVTINHDKDILVLPVDTVVLAVGFQQDRRLAGALDGAAPAIYTVDDAYDAPSALEAIRQGALVGMEI